MMVKRMIDTDWYSERFRKFFQQLMVNEGWISDDKLDLGGHTIAGITEKYHPKEHAVLMWMIENNTEHSTIMASVQSFYYDNYYNPWYDVIADSSLAFKIFDFGVNAGVKRSVKILQRTHNKYQTNMKIKVDGLFGKNTLRAINLDSIPKDDGTETEFYYLYIDNIEKFYRSLWNFFRFGKGWLNRLKRVFNGAKNLTTE